MPYFKKNLNILNDIFCITVCSSKHPKTLLPTKYQNLSLYPCTLFNPLLCPYINILTPTNKTWVQIKLPIYAIHF